MNKGKLDLKINKKFKTALAHLNLHST